MAVSAHWGTILPPTSHTHRNLKFGKLFKIPCCSCCSWVDLVPSRQGHICSFPSFHSLSVCVHIKKAQGRPSQALPWLRLLVIEKSWTWNSYRGMPCLRSVEAGCHGWTLTSLFLLLSHSPETASLPLPCVSSTWAPSRRPSMDLSSTKRTLAQPGCLIPTPTPTFR